MAVTPDDLERELRDCLSRQAVASPPAVDDRAGLAVARGNRLRRRRTAVGAATAALTTALATAAMGQLSVAGGGLAGPAFVLETPWSGHSVPATARATPGGPVPPSDVVVAGQLHTAAGGIMDLAAAGRSVSHAQRARDGWLVVAASSSGGSALWYVTEVGVSRELVPDADALAVAPDGQRVAWRDGARLFAAEATVDQLTATVQVNAPLDGVPVSFLGPSVLMARAGGGQTDAYDLWLPDGNPYQATWDATVTGVYGLLPDGRTAVGQVLVGTAGQPCLALLDAVRDLSRVKTACASWTAGQGPGAVSPDGRWLVVNHPPATTGSGTPSTRPAADDPDRAAALVAQPGGKDGGAIVTDLGTAFEDPAPAAAPLGPPLAGTAAWADEQTIVYAEPSGSVVRARVDTALTGRPATTRWTPPATGDDGGALVVASAVAR